MREPPALPLHGRLQPTGGVCPRDVSLPERILRHRLQHFEGRRIRGAAAVGDLPPPPIYPKGVQSPLVYIYDLPPMLNAHFLTSSPLLWKVVDLFVMMMINFGWFTDGRTVVRYDTTGQICATWDNIDSHRAITISYEKNSKRIFHACDRPPTRIGVVGRAACFPSCIHDRQTCLYDGTFQKPRTSLTPL